jgi:hypothetical protein
VATYPGIRRLLGQPADTLDSIAASLCEHWRAAANSRPAKLFGETSRSWLKVAMSTDVAPAVTISPQAGDSSDTPPDPHPY